MDEKLRLFCLKLSKKLRNEKLVNLFAPHYYRYAQKNIPCHCPICECPYRKTLKYSFVYMHEGRKLIYFDVPKCASASIRKFFFRNRNSLSMRNPEEELDKYFKFTFVRNPWDRMVSNWKMFTTKPLRIKQLRSMTDRDLTEFKDFVQFAAHTKNHHWQPQSLYLPEKLDFIGRLETFNEDINRLLDTIGREGMHQPIGHFNKINRKKYWEYYTPSIVDLVAEMYSEDIERFEYRFEKS